MKEKEGFIDKLLVRVRLLVLVFVPVPDKEKLLVSVEVLE